VRRTVATPLRRAGDAADAPADAGASLPASPVPDGVAAAPQVLHIDSDDTAAQALALLLMPEARVTHAATLAAARELLRQRIFAVVVLDPDLPDGDAAELLPALSGTPLLVYSARQPAWRGPTGVFLAKPWTSPHQLWTTISRLLGIPTLAAAGD
jgi:DNA-binding NtrC family response regulator